MLGTAFSFRPPFSMPTVHLLDKADSMVFNRTHQKKELPILLSMADTAVG